MQYLPPCGKERKKKCEELLFYGFVSVCKHTTEEKMSTWKAAGETGTGRGASEGLTSPEFSAFLRAAQTSPQWNYGQNHSAS